MSRYLTCTEFDFYYYGDLDKDYQFRPEDAETAVDLYNNGMSFIDGIQDMIDYKWNTGAYSYNKFKDILENTLVYYDGICIGYLVDSLAKCQREKYIEY